MADAHTVMRLYFLTKENKKPFHLSMDFGIEDSTSL
jgi:hypothetical protein